MGRPPGRFVLTLAEDGEGEGEQEDQQQDQDPERDSLPHLASSLEHEPARHSNPIRKTRPADRTSVHLRVMYNVAMCSTFSLGLVRVGVVTGGYSSGGDARGR